MGFFGRKKKDELVAVITAAPNVATDDERIAVIAAAISAYEAEQYRQTLCIRKINRTAGTRLAWGLMGMQEAIDTRRM